MRVFFDNLIDYAGVIISAASADPLLPVSNLANALRKKVYRSGGTLATEVITFDLGTAKAATALIILDHNMSNSVDTVSLYGSNDNVTWTTVFDAGLITNPICWHFASASFRYWQITIEKGSPGEVSQIGRVFLGTFYETLEQPDYDGVKITSNDPSTTTASAGGQEYTDVKEKFSVLDLIFSTSPGAQVYQFETIYAAKGIAVPFFVQIDPDNAPLDKVYYVKFSKGFQRGVKAWDGNYFWDTSISLREQI